MQVSIRTLVDFKPGCSVSLQWDLVCDRKHLNQALATYFFLGVMFGAILFGQLSDR